MTCLRLGKELGYGILCIQPDYRIVDKTGKVWYFEWHSYFGPYPLNKKTADPLKLPPEKSPFWDAVSAWDAQGRRTQEGKGGKWAVWEKAKKDAH